MTYEKIRLTCLEDVLPDLLANRQKSDKERIEKLEIAMQKIKQRLHDLENREANHE